MTETDISILMPAYNVGPYISQAINSCISQSFTNFELIIVDDASTDNTKDLVANYCDERIKLKCLARNSGPAVARNFALSHASGKWITVLDADDVWHTDRLDVLYKISNFLGEKSILFDEIQETLENRSGKLKKYRIANAGACKKIRDKEFVEVSADRLIRENIGAQPFFSRNLVLENNIKYPEGINFGEDFYFLVQLLNLKEVKLYQVCKCLYYSRIRQGSLTASPDRLDYSEKVYDLILKNKDLTPTIKTAIEFRREELLTERIYLNFKCLIMRRKWIEVLTVIRGNPNVIWRLIKGLPVSIPYRLRAYLIGSKIR